MTDPHRVARLLVLTASNRLIHGADGPDGWRNTGQGGTTFGGEEFATPLEDVARNLDSIGGDMPEDVARWLLKTGWTMGDGAKCVAPGACPDGVNPAVSRASLARRLDSIGEQRMTQDRARYDLLVELCAGTAALSWASAGLKFPVSRMGSKAGYSHAILSSVGLREGEPLPRYLWNEPDAELARTLALLVAPGGAQAVAEVIRSWIPCPNGHEADGGSWCLDCATWTNGEPPEDAEHVERKRDGTIRRWASGPSTGKQDARRLWERLRKQRPEASPERVGAWMWLRKRTFDGTEAFKSYEHGAGNWENPEETPRRLDTLAPLPATVVCGRAEDIDPERVARALYLQSRTTMSIAYQEGAEQGFRAESHPSSWGDVWSRPAVARDCDTLQPLPADVLCARAEDVPTPPGCSRVLCYIDPPYLNTTGYAHEFDRAAVVAVARRWAEAGAHVVISEAEAIPELVADGWAFSDIADARIGQRRTFSKQQREVLTSNRPLVPRHAWPSRGSDPRQGGLFGGGS